jgi:hypothetical protein
MRFNEIDQMRQAASKVANSHWRVSLAHYVEHERVALGGLLWRLRVPGAAEAVAILGEVFFAAGRDDVFGEQAAYIMRSEP